MIAAILRAAILRQDKEQSSVSQKQIAVVFSADVCL